LPWRGAKKVSLAWPQHNWKCTIGKNCRKTPSSTPGRKIRLIVGGPGEGKKAPQGCGCNVKTGYGDLTTKGTTGS